MSPFEVVYGHKLRAPIDLMPMSASHRSFASANEFAHHIHDLHAEIIQRINNSNATYERDADVHRRLKEFSVGDFVMVQIKPERFPQGIAKKLQARSMGPFKVLKRLGSNAYMLQLPPEMGIIPIFNIEDLVPYKEPAAFDNTSAENSDPFSISDFSSLTPLLPHPRPKEKDIVEDILDDHIVSTRQGGYHKFLVKWKNRPNSDSTWITQEDLQRIDPDILERYYSFISPESSSLQPGGIDADIYDKPFKVYKRRKKRSANPRLSLWSG
ncbi:unnamed protein product [Prunus armeniaca]|uniref:Chromo domain-containing protein n=1 Tax=Prunus armeniaca TaxID=36596 RepID=A0A6J5TMM4_PRUAR|nr:unnamed protein product [Prunus armeniaca]